MKRISMGAHTATALVSLAVIALYIPQPIVGQMGSGSGPGRGMRGPFYEPATETTVKGTVKEVQQLTGKPIPGSSGTMSGTCPRGWSGTHLTLTTDQGN